MRNLKKVLALVLALVMSLSLVTIANASDFTDSSDITYDEAVDVMSAIGVINGLETGAFNPTGILTREQAAKIICTMLLGDGAEKLGTNTSSFTDVAATRWSAPYIEYCASNGIIAGNGNGTFNPTGKLTGHAFAKMLLVALGYDAEIEKFVNTSAWSVNVAKYAVTTGIAVDGVVLSDYLTREQAAQMAFNTLTATLVEYKGGTNITTGDGTSVVVDAERDYVQNLSGSGYKVGVGANDLLMQFCEQYTAKLSLDESGTDKFGRSANKWSFKGVNVGTYADEATYVYTAETKEADIKADLEDYNNYNKTSGTSAAEHKNGYTVTAASTGANTTAAHIAGLTGNGVEVYVYTEDNEIKNIAVIENLVGEVTSVSAKNETITITLKNPAVTLTTDKGYGTFKVDDMVIVTASDSDNGTVDATNSTVQTVAAAQVVTGMATTKNTAKDTITLDGTVYTAAANVATGKDVAAFVVSSKYEATLYLDQYGYVVYAESGTASTSDSAIAVLDVYQTLVDNKITNMVKGVTSNGETVNWELASTNVTTAQGLINKVATYSETDNVYTLTAAAGATTNDGDTYKIASTPAITTSTKSLTLDAKAYFADNVKFIFIDNGKATVLDGAQKVDAGKVAYATIKVEDSTDYITALFVEAPAKNTSSTSDDLVFVVGGSTGTTSVVDSSDNSVKNFKTYDAYINGEKVDNFYTSSTVTGSGFYTIETDNDTGAYVLSGNAYTTTTGDLAVSADALVSGVVNSNLLSIGTDDYDVSKAVFVDTTDNDIESATALKNELDAGKKVAAMVVYDADDMKAAYVYITAYGDYTLATPTTAAYVTWEVEKLAGDATDVINVTVHVAAAQSAGTVTLTATGSDSVSNPSDVTFTNGTAESFTFGVKLAAANVTVISVSIA